MNQTQSQSRSRSQGSISSYQVDCELQFKSLSSTVLNFAEDQDSDLPVDYWRKNTSRHVEKYIQVTGSFISDASKQFEVTETVYGRYGTVISTDIIQTFDGAEPSEMRKWIKNHLLKKSKGLKQPDSPEKPNSIAPISGFEIDQSPEDPHQILRAESDRPTNIADEEELIIELSDEPIPVDVPYRSANLIYQNESYDEPLTVLANVPLPIAIEQFCVSMKHNKTPSTRHNRLKEPIHDFALVNGWPDEEIDRIADRLLLLGIKSKNELDAHLSLSMKYPSEPTQSDYYKRKRVIETITDQNGDFVFEPEILDQYEDWKDKFDPDLYE